MLIFNIFFIPIKEGELRYMIIVLLEASGSGKSIIENELATHHGFEKIISYRRLSTI